MNDTSKELATEESPIDSPIKPEPVATYPSWRAIKPLDVVSLVGVLAAIGVAYAPNIVSLATTWENEPEYTHGFLVLPIALVILWMRWPTKAEEQPTPWSYGWLLVAGTLVLRAFAHEKGQRWSESATIIPLITSLAITRIGWRPMLRTWPAFAFLIFLLPLPPALNAVLSQPLQSMATKSACLLLRLSGLWVMPEGNVILVGNEKLEVAEACNGLSMLMSLAATVAATVSLFPMPTWKRATLLAFIIPIALTCNVLRITVTAWCYHMFGAKIGHDYVHDWAGWAMMPLAMVMVYLLYCLMSWLILESVDTRRSGGELLNLGQPRQAWNAAGRS